MPIYRVSFTETITISAKNKKDAAALAAEKMPSVRCNRIVPYKFEEMITNIEKVGNSWGHYGFPEHYDKKGRKLTQEQIAMIQYDENGFVIWDNDDSCADQNTQKI